MASPAVACFPLLHALVSVWCVLAPAGPAAGASLAASARPGPAAFSLASPDVSLAFFYLSPRGRATAAAASPLPSDSPRARRTLVVRNRMALSLALVHSSVLDPVASPLRYSGVGPGLRVGFDRVTLDRSRELAVALEGEAPRLGSALSSTTGGPREQMVFAAMQVTAARRIGHGFLAGDLLLGGQARLEAVVRSHQYASSANDFYFGWVFAALGPAAAWRLERASGAGLRLEAAAPLLGLSYRPYGDLAYTRSGINPRLAAPPALWGVDTGARWTLPLGGPGSVRGLLEWRLSYRRYRDHDLYRSARDRFGAGLELPLGRAR